MKVLQFYIKYFLFRSTRNVENIKRVIRSQGFKIYHFHPEETETAVAKLIALCGVTSYARNKYAFVATNDIIKGVFVRRNLSVEDEVILLFHEEAHIWLNHLNITGFTDQTPVQKEAAANRFLLQVRFLKAVEVFLTAAASIIALLFLSGRL